MKRPQPCSALAAVCLFMGVVAHAQTNVAVLEIENLVEVTRANTAIWQRAYTNQILLSGNTLRTGERSRAVVRLSNLSMARLGPLSLLKMPDERGAFDFLRGAMYYFHRDKPTTLPVQTPTTFAVIRGTEFALEVAADGTSTLTVFNGDVDLQNQFGAVSLRSGEQGIVEPNQPPRKTAILASTKIIQWVLYYPGVIDVSEAGLNAAEEAALAESLRSYRAGDLLGALAAYPAARAANATTSEQLYRAALLLSVGEVSEASAALGAIAGNDKAARIANALLRVIAAVQNSDIGPANQTNQFATEWLAESYMRQAKSDLPGALTAARRATEVSPQFGFAWARVAELEFSFRRIAQARVALERSLALAPRNAEAHALQGFLLAADNQTRAAIQAFDDAIALDPALGNAWLGRGLCRIRSGDAEGGREDLQVAATLEPTRSVFRSYLGKAWSNEGDNSRATKELRLARELDPNDPTSWLYSALLNAQQNRINEAVRDLERSQALNDNRQVYRSKLLLDEDRAVRSANLATMYRDAGLGEVSVREAARAASFDYANYSSHLFLANSYDALRDPRQVDLRFETAFLSEYLLANLLSPAAVGTLTPQVSQQEYSRLFDRDRFGIASGTEYFSSGDWVNSTVQYGMYKDFSYSAEAAYRTENGDQPNSDFEQLSLTLRLKHQITARDTIYLQGTYYDANAGDVTPRYDPATAIRGFDATERQNGLVVAGYHHEWAPGQHSLVLVGHVPDEVHVNNPRQGVPFFDRSIDGSIFEAFPVAVRQHYKSTIDLYTAEAQQIMTHPMGTLIAGARFQAGTIETESAEANPTFPVPVPITFDNRIEDESDFARASAYAYELWNVHPSLQLIAGISYDWLRYPQNFRFAPIGRGEETTDTVSPKAGFIYLPFTNTVIRGAYTRSLGGVSFDQSFRLEPSQVAGFNQAYRSIIPEAVAGANSAAKFETAGVSVEQKLGTGTYLGLSGEWLHSDVRRDVGAFEFLPPVSPSQTREKLEYHEESLVATLHQLLGQGFSVGTVYRLSHGNLRDTFPQAPSPAPAPFDIPREQEREALLHQVRLFLIYNHPSGFFGQWESRWLDQNNDGYGPTVRDETLWQHDIFIGYRFPRRRAEIRVGILNVTDEDYRLNPLNVISRLPRERTFYSSLQFNF